MASRRLGAFNLKLMEGAAQHGWALQDPQQSRKARAHPETRPQTCSLGPEAHTQRLLAGVIVGMSHSI